MNMHILNQRIFWNFADVSIFSQKCVFCLFLLTSSIKKKFLIQNVLFNILLHSAKFQYLRLSQSKVIQKIRFADVSIFAFFAIFIPISLFRQTKHLSHSTFHTLQTGQTLLGHSGILRQKCVFCLFLLTSAKFQKIFRFEMCIFMLSYFGENFSIQS